MDILTKKERITTNKPSWLKMPIPTGKNYHELQTELKSKGLATVCQEAKCPNLGECWSAKTATMMILGDTCTRGCRFCNVKTGNPKGFVNSDEIEHASTMVKTMGLKYLVITSVDRDDLEDHGSRHFAAIINRIHTDHPDVKVEVLIPDFSGEEKWMRVLANSNPFVIAQNIETVKRLTHPVRDRRASYETTMNVLNFYKTNYPHISTKSSMMLGLGETHQEILETMDDLLFNKVDILTLGQYLQPSAKHLKVEKFYRPEEFETYKQIALDKGFKFVASGPMVRSSYKAADYWDYLRTQGVHI